MSKQPTETEKRIRIAEACGWTDVRETTVLKGRVMRTGIFGNPPHLSAIGYTSNGIIPDYFNDLNEMHEAEKVLPDRIGFMHYLCAEVGMDAYPHGFGEIFILAHATAAQRAEAFGLTLNLWTL